MNPNIAVFQHYDKFVDEDDITRGFEFEEKIFVSREEEPPMFVTTPNGQPDTQFLTNRTNKVLTFPGLL